MTTTAFIAIIASALFHSGYNMLIKLSDEKTLYMWSIFAVAVIAGWVMGWAMVTRVSRVKAQGHPFRSHIGSLFHLLSSLRRQAYASDEGDLSLSYPLTTLAPVFIPLWAFMLLRILSLSSPKQNPKGLCEVP